MRSLRLLSPLLVLGLACGFLGEEPPPEPLEPFPLVLPTWVMGSWQRVVEVDGRQVVEIGCDGAQQTLEVADAGRIALQLGAVRSEVQGAELVLESDGSIGVVLAQGGRMDVAEPEERLLRVRAPALGLAEPVLFAAMDGSVVERVLASSSACGQGALDLSGLESLQDTRFAAPGGTCMQPGLVLDLQARQPAIERAGVRYQVLAAWPAPEGTWLTVLDDSGRRHGVRVDPLPDGSVRVWQRTGRGMASETLEPAADRCR